MGDLSIFAERLKEARIQRDMKQNELAKAIGVSAQTISMYEKSEKDGKGKNPTLENALAIAEKLNVSLDWLCGKDYKVDKSIKTLGDVARLVCDMWYWDSVIFEEHGGFRTEVDGDFETIPTIYFYSGPLRKFIEDYTKLQQLKKENTIDSAMFDDWVSLKIRDLDAIDVESQKPIEDDGELPF